MLLALALLWRLTYVLEMDASPYAIDLGIDGEVFHELALDTAAGRWTNGEAFYQAPVYPWFLGVIYRFCGANPFAVRLVQVLLSVASCWFVFQIASRVFDTETAVVALAISAVYGPFLFFAFEYVSVTLFMFVTLVGVFGLIRAATVDGFAWWGASGLIFGLAAITRGTILPFVALVPLWIILSRRRSRGASRCVAEAAAFSVCVVLVVAPVTLYNYRADGSFILIASSDGLNFYMGNNPDSDGMTAAVVGLRGDQLGAREDHVALARERLGQAGGSAGAVSRFWFGEGLSFISTHPVDALRLVARKAYLLVNAYEIGNNRVVGFMARHSSLYSSASLHYWLVLPLAVAGMVIGRGRRPQVTLLYAFVGSYSLVVIAFLVNARFRLPIVPVLIIFAGAGVTGWYRWLRRREWKAGPSAAWPVAASIIAAVGVGVLARPVESVRNPDAQAFFNEAEAYRMLGDYAAAAQWYERALDDYPAYCDAAFNLGRIRLEIFRDPEAAAAVLVPRADACAGEPSFHDLVVAAERGVRGYSTGSDRDR